MKRLLPFVALLIGMAMARPASAQDDRALIALDLWSKHYFSGKLDLTKPNISRSSPGIRAKVIDPDLAQRISHLKELELICEAAQKRGGEEAAPLFLQLAAVGLDPDARYGEDEYPNLVRSTVEEWLDKLTGKDYDGVVAIAMSDADRGHEAAERAAAIRSMGRTENKKLYEAFVGASKSELAFLRLAAVDAVAVGKPDTILVELSEAIDRETEDAVLARAFDAVSAIVEKHRDSLNAEKLKLVADAVRNAVGRAGWRTDLAAVEVLQRLRAAASVPLLIDILARWSEGSDAEADLKSGLLRKRTHEVLKSLTGAPYGMEDPDRWSEWWTTVRDEFEVAPLENADVGIEDENRTVTGSFFGIKVRGSRILFVIDCSGSMAAPLRTTVQGSSGELTAGTPKMEVAKRELLDAVERLTADSEFNVVQFSNEAELWTRDMVPATTKTKKRFERWVEKLRADGGTNLWQGLVDGLQYRNQGFGEQYGENYDEVFILSDGVPSLGDVRDPKQILRLIAETNRWSRLRINTIYISNSPEDERQAAEFAGMTGAEFMRRLAEENGGTSVTF